MYRGELSVFTKRNKLFTNLNVELLVLGPREPCATDARQEKRGQFQT